ncbi:hypothetical protein SAMN04488065_0548 [Haloplanus vescus]|uniref:Uncharacterized protein n=1 Tax=Haloplanus vescus TaxID=555874 RepID=A0A1H3W465_9EURY|nr:hypothetical protein SAMN04488065_0548 [Haloplanus vescus]
MTPVLLVELNRGALHTVEAPAEFTIDRSFSLELRNHGEAVHAHVHADDALSAVARVDSDGNIFVEQGATHSVPIGVESVDSPVTGTLQIATGYGSETVEIEVTVEPETDDQSVDVDETLSTPQTEDTGPSKPPLTDRLAGVLPSRRTLPVLGLGLLAIAVAISVANAVQTPAVLIGAGVVVGAVLVALVALLR